MIKEKNIFGNAVEGESYAGKTSALEAMKEIGDLRENGIIVVPEYAVMGSFLPFPRESISDLKNSIQRIIDIEKKRTDYLSDELNKNKESQVMFDRGPVSCIAFEYAAEKSGFKGAALWLADAIQKEINDKNIIIPRGNIHLTASKEVIEKRREIDLAKGKGDIMSFLKDEKVIKNLNEAFKTYGEILPEQLFLSLKTDGKTPDEVGAYLLQFIRNQKEDVEDHIPDFVEYAETLIKNKK
ncbi:MAG: hypothetical protein ACOCRX_04010 [Candidatus Woesearchaeota archaeon]